MSHDPFDGFRHRRSRAGEIIAEVIHYDGYEKLPAGVRQYYTREQWLWLSDGEKASLIPRETECEYDN